MRGRSVTSAAMAYREGIAVQKMFKDSGYSREALFTVLELKAKTANSEW
jgi:hypothetical protein